MKSTPTQSQASQHLTKVGSPRWPVASVLSGVDAERQEYGRLDLPEVLADGHLGEPVTAAISTLTFVPGIVQFLAKVWAYFLFTQWIRVSILRLRIGQVLAIGWKGLLVLAFANFLLTVTVIGLLA